MLAKNIYSIFVLNLHLCLCDQHELDIPVDRQPKLNVSRTFLWRPGGHLTSFVRSSKVFVGWHSSDHSPLSF